MRSCLTRHVFPLISCQHTSVEATRQYAEGCVISSDHGLPSCGTTACGLDAQVGLHIVRTDLFGSDMPTADDHHSWHEKRWAPSSPLQQHGSPSLVACLASTGWVGHGRFASQSICFGQGGKAALGAMLFWTSFAARNMLNLHWLPYRLSRGALPRSS